VELGMTVQRGAIPEERRLRRFKEQMTVLGISLLFVLLAAALPISALQAEGWRGALTVAVLMVVIRPLNILISLRRSTMTWREKTLVAWVGPRGIVAASVATVFSIVLTEAGFVEGTRLLTLTFMTIAATVTIQGLSAAFVARRLGLVSAEGRKVVIVGAGSIGMELAQALETLGRPVVLIDRNNAFVERARQRGLTAVDGNALDDLTLERAGAGDAETLVALTPNSEVNALAAHVAQDAFGIPRAYPALGQPAHGANERLLSRVGGHMAFGGPVDIRPWERALDMHTASVVRIAPPAGMVNVRVGDLDLADSMLPLARVRGKAVEIVHADQRWEEGDELIAVQRTAVPAAGA
jgi:hypothetical protein